MRGAKPACSQARRTTSRIGLPVDVMIQSSVARVVRSIWGAVAAGWSAGRMAAKGSAYKGIRVSRWSSGLGEPRCSTAMASSTSPSRSWVIA
jgi:hypothetical protein